MRHTGVDVRLMIMRINNGMFLRKTVRTKAQDILVLRKTLRDFKVIRKHHSSLLSRNDFKWYLVFVIISVLYTSGALKAKAFKPGDPENDGDSLKIRCSFNEEQIDFVTLTKLKLYSVEADDDDEEETFTLGSLTSDDVASTEEIVKMFG
ncbi:hypothetical protein PoB_002031300 [Plakobranchus ocellatus]|uniref:Uncharacterized protein n=1 Tax=Plakobranchus ocellatus TaxID=259542 RepID=A0AAV3ZGV1_9GAST|nr:hypothetical protein PoB_002031300 [Plakobranchus ocellatus]